MSFDVFLQRFSAGEPAEASREPVLAVLGAAKFRGPDGLGFYVIEFPDGVDVEFSAGELQGAGDFNSAAFHIHGMSLHLVRFILEIAKAGDMVILPAMEPFVPILSRPEQLGQLPAELAENEPEPVPCESAEELEALLRGGYAEWRGYRDRIVRREREG